MKKLVLLLAVILTAGGIVWAQFPPPDRTSGSYIPSGSPFNPLFPGFDAVGISSVENKAAPGFNTMVEDFIDPAFFDPNIGTFLLLGGGDGSLQDGTIILGAAKTLGSFYAAGFYKGSIFGSASTGGEGEKVVNTDDNDRELKRSSITWNNNLALLFGIADMGFRLDIIHPNGADTKETYDGNYTFKISNTSGPRFAFSWGAHFGDLYPWAKVGVAFPSILTVGGTNLSSLGSSNEDKKATLSRSGVFNLEAAGLYDFSGGNFTDTVMGSLAFGLKFKDSYKGDKEVINRLESYNDILTTAGITPEGKEFDYGGAWGLDLYLHYRKAFELGKFTMKITPNLRMTLASMSEDISIDDKKNPKPTWFTLEPNVTLGIKYQAFEKLAFFTGIDYRILRWRTYATPGGEEKLKNDDTRWDIDGTKWNRGTAVFDLGMTWTPVKGLVVSTYLTPIVNAFVKFDVQNMMVTPGTLFEDSKAQNIGDWAINTLGKLFGTGFNLTVTYTF